VGEHVEHRALELEHGAHRPGEHTDGLPGDDAGPVGRGVRQCDGAAEHRAVLRFRRGDEDGPDRVDTGDDTVGAGDEASGAGGGLRHGDEGGGVPVSEVLGQRGGGESAEE
jgi:hypothetical protein